MAVSSGTFATRPSAGSDGDIYIPTDSFYDCFVWSSSAWVAVRNGAKCYPPNLSEFTWVNQGGATVSASGGSLNLVAPAGAGNNLRMLKKLSPATPFSLTTLVVPTLIGQNFPHTGILLREASSGKILTVSFNYDDAAAGPLGGVVAAFWWASPTATGTRRGYGRSDALMFSSDIWLRLEDDGTNTKVQFSVDGQNFIEIYSAVYATNFTVRPDEIGFFCQSNNATFDAVGALISWDKFDVAGSKNYAFWGIGAVGSQTGQNVCILGV